MASYNGTAGNDSLLGGSGDDTLVGGAGNDTLDGGAGFNTAQYAGSEYDYIVTRLDDGGFSIRAKANTPTETDGTDVLRNVQTIQFLDGNTQRVMDDYANVQASTNLVKGFGEQVTGQTFRGDKDWFQVTGGRANQAVHVAFAGGSNSTLSLSTGGSVGENSNSPNALFSGVLSANGSLGVDVSNYSLGLNAVLNYRFTVLRDLVGTNASETLTAGTGYEYLDAGKGDDVLIGSSRSDYLVGGEGSDTLISGGGADVIVGGDGPDDRDVAVFAGRLSDYTVMPLNGNMTNPAQDDWWTVTNKASGAVSWVKGVEVLSFDDLNYTIDDYDTFIAADIQGRPSYAQLGQTITGSLRTGYDQDWIAFDFGRSVVDRNTTLKVTVSFDGYPVQGKHLSFIDVSGSQLQFTDLSSNSAKSSFDFGWNTAGTQSFLIKGLQWGPNAEGGAFGGGQAFLWMYGDATYDHWGNPFDASNSNQGAYTISVSKYREGTVGNDVLTTDGASATTQVDELAGLGGNDKLVGSGRAERFDGGDGNDTIEAGAGDDVLKGGMGNDLLKGEDGNDTFVVVGESGAADTVMGGSGADTLRVEGDADLRLSTFDSVEQLQGTGSNRVYLTTAQIAGFTKADNVILSGPNQSFVNLAGNYILEGTSSDDVLVAGDGDNVLRPFAGNNTVVGGAGNDTVVWERGWGVSWEQQYRGEHVLSSKYIDRNYIIQGSYEGGAGNDRLEFRIQDGLYQPWGYQYDVAGTSYSIDLTQAIVSGFESLGLVTSNFIKNGATYSWGPSSIFVTAAQLTQMTGLSGGSFVVKGGGSVDLSSLSLSAGATVTFDGDVSYSVTGTAASDVISTLGGNDSVLGGLGNDVISAGAGVDTVRAGDGDDVVIISGKGSVTDVIDGGAGVDTLRVTGSDVDLSVATLTSIEKLEANSVSLALTQAQFDTYSANMTGSAGLILKMTSAGSKSVSSLPSSFVGISGSGGSDTLLGGAGNDVLVGDAGNDSIDGGAGNDRLLGDAGNDTLIGGQGNDVLLGGEGADNLIGSEGDDTVDGGVGNDMLSGDAGNDQLLGGGGDDTLKGGAGNDTLQGGDGIDTSQYLGKQSGYSVKASKTGDIVVTDIDLTDGNDGVDTLQGIEKLAFSDGTISVAITGRSDASVNSYSNSSQMNPSMSPLVGGGYVTVWQSNGQDGSDWGVYAQRFNAAGARVGSELRLNTTTNGNQSFSDDEVALQSVAGLPDGGFVTSWRSTNSDGDSWGVVAQRFDANGVAVGSEIKVNTYTVAEQREPSVAVLIDGKFVITWMSANAQDGSGWGVYGQVFNAQGVKQGSEFLVNTATSTDQLWPHVSALSGGGFVTTWRDNSTDNAKAQIFDASGVKVGSEFTLNTYTSNWQFAASTTALADGGFWATWQSADQDGSSWGIFAQRFDSTGLKVGSEIRVNTYTQDQQNIPQISSRADGSFVVAWSSQGQDGSDWGVYVQQFDANGGKVDAEIKINDVSYSSQYHPDVLALPNGKFVVTWEAANAQDGSDWGIFSKTWDPVSGLNGLVVTGDGADNFINQANAVQIDGGAGADTLQGGADNTTYIVDNSGDVVIEETGGGTDEVKSSVSATLAANVENLTLTGTANTNATGNALNNVIVGNSGNNSLGGGAGNDTLLGFEGDDTLTGGAGDDYIDGGSGFNTLVLSGSRLDYSVPSASKLDGNGFLIKAASDAVAAGNLDGIDSVKNIQRIVFAGETDPLFQSLTIDDYSNVAGADNLQLQYGVTYTGKIDFINDVDYFKLTTVAGTSIQYNFSAPDWNYRSNLSGQFSNRSQGGDSFVANSSGTFDFNVYAGWSGWSNASQYALTLRRNWTGTDGADSYDFTSAGADQKFERLSGGLGNDSLFGGAVSDSIEGGDGNDLLRGSGGNDTLDGGSGLNTVSYLGARADFDVVTLGSGQWQVTHKGGGADGVDLLRNVQTLQFSDGNLLLDDYSNSRAGALSVNDGSFVAATWGQFITGAAQFGGDIDVFKFDFGNLGIGKSLRFTLDGGGAGQRFHVVDADGNELYFKDASGNDVVWLYSGQSYVLKPDRWGPQGETFMGGKGWVELYADGAQPTGTQYTLSIARYLEGTAAADTLDVITTVGGVTAQRFDELSGLGGNDILKGAEKSDRLLGGDGNDSLSGAGGDDYLSGGSGRDTINAGDGNDTIDVTSQGAVTDVIDGGSGIDTLLVSQGVTLDAATMSGVEIITSTNGGNFSFSPTQLLAMGVTQINNLNLTLSAPGTLDASALGGNFGLVGTTGTDVLKGSSGSNVITPRGGSATVDAGAGDDTILFQATTGEWQGISSAEFLRSDGNTHTYFLDGSYEGGAGNDTLQFNFPYSWWTNAWGGSWAPQGFGYSYTIDLSGANLSSIETLMVSGADYGANLMMTATQLSAFSSLSGVKGVQLVGGGSVDLTAFAAKGGVNLSFADSVGYTLVGGSGADTMADTLGNDVLSGGAGADQITSLSGQDTIRAGTGDDIIVVGGKSSVLDVFDGGDGTDTLRVTGTDVDLSGATLTGIERIEANSQSLSLTAAQFADFGSALVGDAKLILKMTSAGQADVGQLSSKFAGIRGSSGSDTLLGGAGNDLLVGDAGNDFIDGGAGNDRLVGDIGNDVLFGGLGNDVLMGGEGDDLLQGGEGNDSLYTGAGLDALYGGAGDDQLWITDKSVSLDLLDGGAGNDTLNITAGVDLKSATLTSIEGLAGTGTVKLASKQLASLQTISGVHVELTDTPALSDLSNVVLSDGASIALPSMDPSLAGQAGLLGSKFDDTINGSAQDDVIWGGLGADRLDGQVGNDTLMGGSGVDTLLGGAGNDQFIVSRDEFNQASGGGFTFSVSGKDYSGGTNHYLYSDIIDGGAGTDSLSVQFSNDSSIYLFREGSVSNIENLSLDISSGWSWREFWISADSLSALNSVSVVRGSTSDWAKLAVNVFGNGQNFAPTAITSIDGIRKFNLLGSYGDIDFSKLTVTGNGDWNFGIQVWNADNIQLSAGDDALLVTGDNTFNVRAGSGNDRVAVQSVGAINGVLDGGEGASDTLDISSLGYVDLTNAIITGFETINQGATTLLMTQAQASMLTLQGDGRKYIKEGGVVTLTSSNDSFTGSGTELVSGGRGNDYISTVNTAVFTGNFANYDLQWQNGSYVVQQSRGSLVDGTDTLNNVLKISFADTANPIQLDDNFNNYLGFSKHTFVNYQLDDGVDKRISARKDYNGDVDVFTTSLVPSSPFFIQGSTQNGNFWHASFVDIATAQQLVFRSLVNGWDSWEYNAGMEANAKWVPGFYTPDGFVAYQGGNVYFNFWVDGDVQNYAFTLKYLDDYLGSKDTLGQMDPLKGQIKGYIGDVADTDWIRTSLIKGTKYEFNLQGLGSGKGTLANPSLSLFDSQGRLVESGFDLTLDAVGQDDKLVFRPTDTGTYYLQVKDTSGLYTGSWTLTQESLDTIAGNISTTERAEWTADKTFSVTSEVNKLGDQDWFRVWLDQGMSYEFHALGATTAMGNTLGNPLLSLYSVTGSLLEVGKDFVGTDDRLVYQAPDSGWYYLALGASGNASKGTYTVTGSSLKDDFGNTYSSSAIISLGTTVHGTISFNDDTDWLQIGLTAGQTYRIDLTSDNSSSILDPLRDPMLVIRNAQGQVVAEADDFGTQLNARSYFTATTTGVYYLEAKSAFKFDVGAWALKVDLAPADDFASDLSRAISATPPANLGSLTVNGQTPAVLSGEIGAPGDVDLFKVSLQAGTVYQIAAEGFASHKGSLADPYVRLFNSSGHLVAFDDDDGSGTDAQFYVAPTTSGDYFIQVSTDNSKAMGTYQVSVAARNIAADEAASNVSTQAVLSVGESFKGNLLTHGDTDWVRIQLNQGQDYVFRAQGAGSGQGTLLDPMLELRAADGSLIGSYDNGLISQDAFTVFTPQASGTYYLVVKSGDALADTGTYTLVSRAPDDYADTAVGATTLSLDQTLTGGIQWATGSFGVRAQDSLGLATDMDVDWFKIHANAGQVLSVTVAPTQSSSLSRPMIEVISSDLSKRTIAIGDGLETLNGAAVATFKSAAAGDYYVRVIDGAGATGDYTIHLAQGDASDEDRNGPVSMVLKTIEQGGVTTQNATIGLAGDSDNFTFQALAGHNYRVETLAVRDGTHAPLSGAHLSVDMTTAGVAGSAHIENTIVDRTPSTFEGAVFKVNAAGVATLSVSAAQDFQTGQYQVRVTDLGDGSDDHADRVADVPKDSLGAVLNVMAGNDTATGEINANSDVDLFAIQLTEGEVYELNVLGYADGLGTLGEAGLKLLDAQGHLVSSGDFNAETGRTQLDVSVFDSGMYYVAVSGLDKVLGSLGSYTLQSRVQDLTYSGPDDWAADVQTAAVAAPGRAVNGNIQYDIDHDWISANLTDGHTYVIDILGDGSGSGGHLKDGYLRVLDAAGNEVMTDDNSGAGNDARVIIQANATGTYYFDVSSRDGGLGDYTVRLRELYSGTADPLQSSQWYLNALHLPELQGQFSGAGVLIGMVDDGIDTSHPDLQSQIDFALSYDAVYKTSDGKNKIPYPTFPSGDFHGTAVAGIMVAAANNDTGIAGIAYEAEVASTRVKWSWNQIVDALGKQYQFDVSNNSWGTIDAFTDSFNDTTLTFAYQAIRHAVEDGRHGLGTVMVFSAGNSASYGANTNYSNFANAREVITVGAVQADGSAAAFSTPGANVLVSAYGVDLLTTDRHEPGLGLNQSSNYTSFSGTSAAAPVVSAVVALMLEANPNLGYRDVQEILAYSASHPADQSWKENGAHNFNLGGLSFNDKLGFGMVNAYAAVQLAQTWTGHNTAMNEVVSSARAFGLHDTLSDSGTVYSRTFTLSGDMTVDHVELGIDLRHTRMGDLVIELISPNGTVSRLMDRPTVNPEQPYGLSGIDSNVPTHLLWDFSSVQYMGEKVAGDWTVQITDVRPEETGTIQSLSLRAYGSADKGNDTYVFSDEGFVANGGLMGTLADEYGTDTLNDAMMLQSVTVDLSAHTMSSNGAFYRIADWSQIENVVTGAAADSLTGNELDNALSGRAGDDTLIGGLGNDTFDGGAGTDTVIYAGKKSEYNISYDAKTGRVTVVDNNIANGNDGSDKLINIETIKFSDQELSLSKTVGNRAPIVNKRFFDQPIQIDKGDGIDYHLPDDIFVDPDVPVPSDPIAPVPADPADPHAPVVLGETIGEVLFSVAYFDGYDANSEVAVAHVSCQLKPGVSLQDLHVATSHIEINGRAIQNSSAIQILNVSQDGQTANFDIRVDPTKLNPNELVESLDFSVNFDPTKVDTQSVLVDLTSSTFGISNVFERKNPSLDNLDITVTQEDGSNLPDWLYFDPVTRKFVGTPPDNFQGQIKVLIQALDDFGTSASGVLKLQFGDNQAPVLEAVRAIEVAEDAPLLALNIVQPTDPEGESLSVTIDSTPVFGTILKANGSVVKAGDVLTAADLTELHYMAAPDANGNAGSLSYTVTDAGGAVASSSLKIFVQAANDAPRFGQDSKLIINYPGSDDVILELNKPTDPESTISTVAITELPVLGQAFLNGQLLQLGQIVNVADLSKVHFSLRENVNGPIGAIGLQATDDQGATGTWRLQLEVKGTTVTSSGTAGDDTLYGSINADSLYGLGGNDTLVGNPGDDRLVGGTGSDSLLGGVGSDTLDGGSGDDTLDGGAGVDLMSGGPGNDTYWVDNAADRVVETLPKGAGGVDTVLTSVTFVAPSNVENVTATESAAINLTGNELDNVLAGNAQDNVLTGGAGVDTLLGLAGNDTLNGGEGIDKMAGGVGNDTYFVDSRFDVIMENLAEGTDTVYASTNYTLAANLENLFLLSGGDWSGAGNSLANRIVGNEGNNLLSGGLGADTLEGGLGNDIYVLTDNLDTIIDVGGIDTIRSANAIDLTRLPTIERAELIGVMSNTLAGNLLDNELVGNSGDNFLDGGAGIDRLTGGLGGDGFFVGYNGAGKLADVITDFDAAQQDYVLVDVSTLGVNLLQAAWAQSGFVNASSFVKADGAVARDADDFFLLNTATGELSFDADGSGVNAAIAIARFEGDAYKNLTPQTLYLSV